MPLHNLFAESLTWLFHLLNASCSEDNNRVLIVIPLICIGARLTPRLLTAGLCQLACVHVYTAAHRRHRARYNLWKYSHYTTFNTFLLIYLYDGIPLSDRSASSFLMLTVKKWNTLSRFVFTDHDNLDIFKVVRPKGLLEANCCLGLKDVKKDGPSIF